MMQKVGQVPREQQHFSLEVITSGHTHGDSFLAVAEEIARDGWVPHVGVVVPFGTFCGGEDRRSRFQTLLMDLAWKQVRGLHKVELVMWGWVNGLFGVEINVYLDGLT